MGIAALVLGIVALAFGFVPFCNIFALFPAAVGLVLGLIDWVNKKKEGASKGKAIAGMICSVIAIVVILFYYFAFVLVAKKAAKNIGEGLQRTDWNTIFSTDDTNYDIEEE